MDILGELPSDLCTALSQGKVTFRWSSLDHSKSNSSSPTSDYQLQFCDHQNSVEWTAKAVLCNSILSTVEQIKLGNRGNEVSASTVFIIEKSSWCCQQTTDTVPQGVAHEQDDETNEKPSSNSFATHRSETIETDISEQNTSPNNGSNTLRRSLLRNMVTLLAASPLSREEIIQQTMNMLAGSEDPVTKQDICTCLTVIAIPSEMDDTKMELKPESYVFLDLDKLSSDAERKRVANRAFPALLSIRDIMQKREGFKELMDQLGLYADRDIFLGASGRGIMSGLSGAADNHPRHGRKRGRNLTVDDEEEDNEASAPKEGVSGSPHPKSQMTTMDQCPVDWDQGDLRLLLSSSSSILSSNAENIITRRIKQRDNPECLFSNSPASSLVGLPIPVLTSSSCYKEALSDYRLLLEQHHNLQRVFSEHLRVLKQVQSCREQRNPGDGSESRFSTELVKQIDEWVAEQVVRRSALEAVLSRLESEMSHLERDVLEYLCMDNLGVV